MGEVGAGLGAYVLDGGSASAPGRTGRRKGTATTSPHACWRIWMPVSAAMGEVGAGLGAYVLDCDFPCACTAICDCST